MRRPLIFAALVLAVAGCSTLDQMGRTIARLTSPVSLAPDSRLAEAVRDPERCQTILREEGMAFTPARDQTEGEFCIVANAVMLGATPVRTSPARPMMSCPLAAGFLLWTRYSVEPAAQAMLGSPLRQVDHFGVYACRRVYNQTEGRVSAHARAQALDVAAFRLADGRRVAVERSWPAQGAEAAFLRKVRDDACKVFGSVLSPDYNAAHANHLHLEYGGRGPCS